MKRIILLFLLALISCEGSNPETKFFPEPTLEDGGTEAGIFPEETRLYTESTLNIVNPERGFYKTFNLTGSNPVNAANSIRNAGYSIAYAQIYLEPYRDVPIPDTFLAMLESGFAAARSAGIKLIVRPVYNDESGGEDAPLEKILEDIERLALTLQANKDVILLEQAGFIGAWGEWHSSTSGNDTTEIRSEVLKEMLWALPGRFISIRTPMFKEEIFPGGPLLERRNNLRGRTGHHNDCFLSSRSDYGTYDDPIEEWEAYVSQETLYVPMGGETCSYYPPRSDCSFAVPEMERNHWSYLNNEYNQVVHDIWREQGCFDEIEQRLGYRFVLRELSTPVITSAGENLNVEFSVDNVGFAAPFNNRPVFLVFTKSGVRRNVSLKESAKFWAAGIETIVNKTIIVPSMPSGTYTLSLWLPDSDVGLRSDSRYSIQFANTNTWDEVRGMNRVGEIIVE